MDSESCKHCHEKEYIGWLQTRIANVVRDPKDHPEAVPGDFSGANPVRTFGLDEVAFVYRQLEELKPGVTNFFQYADLTAHKNRMQGNDFVQSTMYHRGLRCCDCHDVHSNQNESTSSKRAMRCALAATPSRIPPGSKEL